MTVSSTAIALAVISNVKTAVSYLPRIMRRDDRPSDLRD